MYLIKFYGIERNLMEYSFNYLKNEMRNKRQNINHLVKLVKIHLVLLLLEWQVNIYIYVCIYYVYIMKSKIKITE